jgi:hypothetical protein
MARCLGFRLTPTAIDEVAIQHTVAGASTLHESSGVGVEMTNAHVHNSDSFSAVR